MSTRNIFPVIKLRKFGVDYHKRLSSWTQKAVKWIPCRQHAKYAISLSSNFSRLQAPQHCSDGGERHVDCVEGKCVLLLKWSSVQNHALWYFERYWYYYLYCAQCLSLQHDVAQFRHLGIACIATMTREAFPAITVVEEKTYRHRFRPPRIAYLDPPLFASLLEAVQVNTVAKSKRNLPLPSARSLIECQIFLKLVSRSNRAPHAKCCWKRHKIDDSRHIKLINEAAHSQALLQIRKSVFLKERYIRKHDCQGIVKFQKILTNGGKSQ